MPRSPWNWVPTPSCSTPPWRRARPVAMAAAMKHAVLAGRLAYCAGASAAPLRHGQQSDRRPGGRLTWRSPSRARSRSTISPASSATATRPTAFNEALTAVDQAIQRIGELPQRRPARRASGHAAQRAVGHAARAGGRAAAGADARRVRVARGAAVARRAAALQRHPRRSCEPQRASLPRRRGHRLGHRPRQTAHRGSGSSNRPW